MEESLPDCLADDSDCDSRSSSSSLCRGNPNRSSVASKLRSRFWKLGWRFIARFVRKIRRNKDERDLESECLWCEL